MRIKRFNENLKSNLPGIGDYVICDVDDFKDDRLSDFISVNIGIVDDYYNDEYDIKYKNIPYSINHNFSNEYITVNISNIIYSSHNIEDVINFLSIEKDSNKFNL